MALNESGWHGLPHRLLDTPHNSISMAMTLETFRAEGSGDPAGSSMLGSMLFSRFVSGTRVVCQHYQPPPPCTLLVIERHEPYSPAQLCA
jgi:hypothetical protein